MTRAEKQVADEAGFKLVLTRVTKSQLAKGLGITRQSITRWKKIPIHHVKLVSEITELPREKILPSVYKD